MRISAASGLRTLISIIAGVVAPSGTSLASLDFHRDVPFSLSGGHFIVVKGEVENRQLRLVIDTGASYSVMDRQAVRDLNLMSLTGSVSVQAFGRTVPAGRVVISGLSLGSALTSLPCLVVDLPWPGIDGILGLDFLRRQSLTIDYERRHISFGRRLELDSRVSFRPDRSLVLVPVRVKDRELLLSVDSGSPEISFDEEASVQGIRRLPGLTRHFRRDVTGSVPVERVGLPTVLLGDGRWKGLTGTLRRRSVSGRDGVLGLAALDFRRVHFEFKRGVFSWER